MEYKGRLEKAILSNRTLLDELNDAFCQTHPWLAQKVTTRSAMLLLAKLVQMLRPLNIWRTKAGGLLKDVHAINAIKLSENDILAGVRHHSAASEPYFYDTSYNHTKQHGPIPVDLNGRCVIRWLSMQIHLPKIGDNEWDWASWYPPPWVDNTYMSEAYMGDLSSMAIE